MEIQSTIAIVNLKLNLGLFQTCDANGKNPFGFYISLKLVCVYFSFFGIVTSFSVKYGEKLKKREKGKGEKHHFMGCQCLSATFKRR